MASFIQTARSAAESDGQKPLGPKRRWLIADVGGGSAPPNERCIPSCPPSSRPGWRLEIGLNPPGTPKCIPMPARVQLSPQNSEISASFSGKPEPLACLELTRAMPSSSPHHMIDSSLIMASRGWCSPPRFGNMLRQEERGFSSKSRYPW